MISIIIINAVREYSFSSALQPKYVFEFDSLPESFNYLLLHAVLPWYLLHRAISRAIFRDVSTVCARKRGFWEARRVDQAA